MWSGDEIVEIAIAGARDEGRDLFERVDEGGTLRIPGITHGDPPAVRELCHLDAVSTGVAAAALLPDDRQASGRHAVLRVVHVDLSESEGVGDPVRERVHVHRLLRLQGMESMITHVRKYAPLHRW